MEKMKKNLKYYTIITNSNNGYDSMWINFHDSFYNIWNVSDFNFRISFQHHKFGRNTKCEMENGTIHSTNSFWYHFFLCFIALHWPINQFDFRIIRFRFCWMYLLMSSWAIKASSSTPGMEEMEVLVIRKFPNEMRWDRTKRKSILIECFIWWIYWSNKKKKWFPLNERKTLQTESRRRKEFLEAFSSLRILRFHLFFHIRFCFFFSLSFFIYCVTGKFLVVALPLVFFHLFIYWVFQ